MGCVLRRGRAANCAFARGGYERNFTVGGGYINYRGGARGCAALFFLFLVGKKLGFSCDCIYGVFLRGGVSASSLYITF